MLSTFRHLAALSFACLLLAGTVARADSAVEAIDSVETQVSDTTGKSVELSAFKGKPTVLLYEDRSSTEQNRKFKDELWRRGHETGLLNAANVVGVANLSSFNFWPAKRFAVSHVEQMEKKVGIPVLIDWKGKLQQSPWKLPENSSTVMVFDPSGKLVFQHSGGLNEQQMEEVFGMLTTMLGVASRTPGNPHG